MPQVKSVDALMKYLRSHHGIAIKGSVLKRKLRNIGYYHGYKGYRFIRKPANRIAFSDFREIVAINELDQRLKSLFYSRLMFVETALKNYVLEIFMKHSKTHNFSIIYNQLITDYRRHSPGSKSYKEAVQKRLKVRDQIFSALTRDFGNGHNVVKHFYDKDEPVPIWAIFEVLTLGQFGFLVECCETAIKREIGKSLQINAAFDSDGCLTEKIIFLIRDLRNAVAHHAVVFDARFNRRTPANRLIQCLTHETGAASLSFEFIIDYLVLITYVLKNLAVPKLDLRLFLRDFQALHDDFYRQMPPTVYLQVFGIDARTKMAKIQLYVAR